MATKIYDSVMFTKPEAAVAEIEARLARGEDECDGDYDEAANAMVEWKWPSVIDWECEYITSAKPGSVSLNGLSIVFPDNWDQDDEEDRFCFCCGRGDKGLAPCPQCGKMLCQDCAPPFGGHVCEPD